MKRTDFEHNLNCLHVYCRLRCLHVPQKPAIAIGKIYEALAHRILYASGGRASQYRDPRRKVWQGGPMTIDRQNSDTRVEINLVEPWAFVKGLVQTETPAVLGSESPISDTEGGTPLVVNAISQTRPGAGRRLEERK